MTKWSSGTRSRLILYRWEQKLDLKNYFFTISQIIRASFQSYAILKLSWRKETIFITYARQSLTKRHNTLTKTYGVEDKAKEGKVNTKFFTAPSTSKKIQNMFDANQKHQFEDRCFDIKFEKWTFFCF